MTQAEAEEIKKKCHAAILPMQNSSPAEAVRVLKEQKKCNDDYTNNTRNDFGSRFNETQNGSASGARTLTDAEKEALKQKSAAAAAPAATATATATGSYIVLGVLAIVVFGVIYFITRK